MKTDEVVEMTAAVDDVLGNQRRGMTDLYIIELCLITRKSVTAPVAREE